MGKKSLKKVVMGVDIGGTKIASGLVSNGKLVTKITTEKTPAGKKILDVVSGMFKKLSKKYIISAIGISTAGMVSDKGQIVGSCGNIPGWEGTKVSKILGDKFGLPVVVENDANSAAFAEYHIGGAKGANPLLMITLGTGVGGGVVVNGKLVRGANYAGGEIGHIQLGYDKQRRCTCGKYDCFEAYASGNGLIALIGKYFPSGGKNMTTHSLFKLAKSKAKKDADKKLLAIRAIEDWHFYIALGISNLVHVFDPGKVVLSGGLSKEIDIKYLKEEAKELFLPALRKPLMKGMIEKSILSNDAGLIGAALLASQHVEI